MARRYYRRRRYYRKRKRWSTNIDTLDFPLTIGANANSSDGFALCQNGYYTNNAVKEIYTVKNIEVQYTVEVPTQYLDVIENLCCYIVYVPEGMTIMNNPNFIKQHPEYIMAYKYLGTGNDDGDNYRNPLYIKSRLSRNLNTGDSIQFMLTYKNDSSINNIIIRVYGVVRWWSRSN